MHPDELADYTLRDFFRKVEGFNQVKQQDYRNSYEAARLTSWMVISSLTGKSTSPQGLLRFEWEKQQIKPTREKLTDRKNELMKRWKVK